MPKKAKNPDEPPVSDDDPRGPYTVLGARSQKVTDLDELQEFLTLPDAIREHMEARVERFEATNPTEEEREKFNEVDFALPEPVQDYLDLRVKARFTENTLHSRQSNYRHYMVYCLVRDEEFLEPDMITVEEFVDHQLLHGYAESTIENRVYDLSVLFKYLVKKGIVDSNPIQKDEFDMGVSSSDGYKEIRYIETDDYDLLLDEIEDTRDFLMVQLLWNCGVRAVELVNIEISDIADYNDDDDVPPRSIEIETAKNNGYEDRTVFYPARVERTLKKWLERGGRDAYLRSDESDYLLLGQSSEQLNSDRPTEIIREYASDAGIQAKVDKGPNAAGEHRNTVTSHAFRHSYAVHRVRNGMPIVFLADLLGHSDVSQTRDYLRFKKEDHQEADKRYRP